MLDVLKLENTTGGAYCRSNVITRAPAKQIDYSVFLRVYFVCCSRAQAKCLLTNTVVAHGGDTAKDLYTATIS